MNLSGKAEDVFAAFPLLTNILLTELSLSVQPTKSAYATHPAAASAASALSPPVPLGQRVQLPNTTGVPLALGIVHGGIPIGDANFKKGHLDDLWTKVEAEARMVHENKLRDHPQHRHQMLTLNTQSTVDY
jgi:hypothetical protein